MNSVVKKDISDASHKIALLAVLVAGILFSFLIVSIKSKVRLEKPIKLPYSGFFVSLPAGERWSTRTEQWIFSQDENYFYCGAVATDKGLTTAVVQWRYIICPEGENPRDVFENRGKELGGYSGQKKIYIGDGFGANLAYFRHESGEHIYLALVILEPGRSAELEVRGTDPYFAEDVFNSVLGGARFEGLGLLNKGRMLVERVLENPDRADGVNDLLESLYLLESNGLMDGFSGLRRVLVPNGVAVRSVTYAGIGPYDMYRQNYFTRTLDGRITWKFVQRGSQAPLAREILLEVFPNDRLIMTDFTAKTEKTRKISSVIWPEIVEFELYKAFVNSDFNEFVVDMLMSQGQVLPVHITKQKQDDGLWQLSLTYLHTPDLELKIYVTNDGIITRRTIDSGARHKLTLCDREDIVARYPQESAFLQQLFE